MNHKLNETMTHTHTPGPWIAECNCIRSELGNQRFDLVAIVPLNHNEWGANARLIAAAPELLEALQMLMPQEPQETDSYDRAMWGNARAAIAKATGKGAA